MKVAFVSLPSYYYHFQHQKDGMWGGAEVQQSLIASELSRRGNEIVWVVNDGPALQGVTLKDRMLFIPLVNAPSEVLGLTPMYMLPFPVLQLYNALLYADADIYYQRIGEWTTGIVGLFKTLENRPFVFALAHDDHILLKNLNYSRTDRKLISYGIRKATAVVVQTNYQKELLMETYGIEGHVIPSIAPTVPPSPQEGGETGERYVLWVGRMEGWKRPGLFLDIAERMPHMKFIMVGGRSNAEPELYDTMKERASRLDNVSFLGHMSYNETLSLFRNALAYVNTSLQEGFPNTFLQAWVAGTPVVSLAVDPDGILSEGELGYLANDVNECVDTLESIREKTPSAVHRAREYVRSHHSTERVGTMYEMLFSSLIE